MISVIQRYPNLCKISFIGHSLGGLIARYAIALLYGGNYLNRISKLDGEIRSNGSTKVSPEENYIGKIAGLQPVNFITVATPHLGSRGHNQVITLHFSLLMTQFSALGSWSRQARVLNLPNGWFI